LSLPAGYSAVGAHPHELAIGFEPLDALRGGRVGTPLRFEIEGPLPLHPADEKATYRRAIGRGPLRPVIGRHDSCLFALLYHQTQPYSQPPQQPMPTPDVVNLRIYDHRRRFVPRRFALPVPPLVSETNPPIAQRVRRPWLFPGAACDLSARSTGIRARVTRMGEPLRWARIEARLEGGGMPLVGRAHGDDRGEFLLVLDPAAAPATELVDPLPVRVTAFAPASALVPMPADLPSLDFLWDLPLEVLPAPGAPDPVSTGAQLPAGYVETPSSSRLVPFRLGRLISVPDFVFA
jgi:hypothetical protein